jgi:hypothetical protein
MPSDIDELAPDGEPNQVAVCAQIEFPHDTGAVCVYCPDADVECRSYFFITLPQRQ